jgi:hypothetical protein
MFKEAGLWLLPPLSRAEGASSERANVFRLAPKAAIYCISHTRREGRAVSGDKHASVGKNVSGLTEQTGTNAQMSRAHQR